MEARLPKDEEARLAVLRQYNVLDSPQESDFDELVGLAAQICQTPISLVSLVDRDRQWFKGRYGLDISETPRRISFCAHTILEAPQTLEVTDATKDERFADSGMVTDSPHVRFYAGAPLVTPEGQPLGTLCVLDTKPRRLTEQQKHALEVLSRQVMTQLELRRRLAELQCASEQLVAAHDRERRQQEVLARKQAEAMGELEAFSYSLSHDIRAPLRAMRNFIEIVLATNRDRLGETGTTCLQKSLEACGSMDHLVTDVLAFSRISRVEIRMRTVEVDQLAHRIVRERPELQPPKANVQICSPLGRVVGDEASLTQCLGNLLGNAVKYVAPGIRPRVQVYSEPRGDWLRIIVADNGIGIPPESREAIFGLFHRLHSNNEYEGTGIGLAIVKRAVERMSGHVGVDSEPGQGSRFWIELKEAQPPRPQRECRALENAPIG